MGTISLGWLVWVLMLILSLEVTEMLADRIMVLTLIGPTSDMV